VRALRSPLRRQYRSYTAPEATRPPRDVVGNLYPLSEAANFDVLLSAVDSVWQWPKGYDLPGAVKHKVYGRVVNAYPHVDNVPAPKALGDLKDNIVARH
jgi:hypothetical protein